MVVVQYLVNGNGAQREADGVTYGLYVMIMARNGLGGRSQ